MYSRNLIAVKFIVEISSKLTNTLSRFTNNKCTVNWRTNKVRGGGFWE